MTTRTEDLTTLGPWDNCPLCRYLFNAASPIGDEPASPKPGDFSVCLACGEPLVYQDDLRVRSATQEDLAGADGETRALLSRASTGARQFAQQRAAAGEVLPSQEDLDEPEPLPNAGSSAADGGPELEEDGQNGEKQR